MSERPLMMNAEDARRAERRLNRRIMGAGGIDVVDGLDSVVISGQTLLRQVAMAGGQLLLGWVVNWGRDGQGLYITCKLVDAEHQPVGEELRVRAWTDDELDDWTDAHPKLWAGREIPLQYVSPTAELYCVWEFFCTCPYQSGGVMPIGGDGASATSCGGERNPAQNHGGQS